MKPILEIRGVSHCYTHNTPVLNGLDFSLERGEIVCLLGSSGCGKTTALRVIAGFEAVTGGEVLLEGVCVSEPGRTLPPEERQVGIVFQEAALFPHLTVAQNIGFGLHRLDRRAREERVARLLETVALTAKRGHYPHQLSGGQRQRTALARAMAPNPKLILLDEPFSNLDEDLRRTLSREVRELLQQQEMSAVLVTHDQHEAFAMADRIGVMNAGRIEQMGSGSELFHSPATRFVAGFIGEGCFLEGRATGEGTVDCILGRFRTAPTSFEAGTPLEVLVRPGHLVSDPESELQARIIDADFRGSGSLYTLVPDGGCELRALFPDTLGLKVGDRLSIRLAAETVCAYPKSK